MWQQSMLAITPTTENTNFLHQIYQLKEYERDEINYLCATD